MDSKQHTKKYTVCLRCIKMSYLNYFKPIKFILQGLIGITTFLQLLAYIMFKDIFYEMMPLYISVLLFHIIFTEIVLTRAIKKELQNEPKNTSN